MHNVFHSFRLIACALLSAIVVASLPLPLLQSAVAMAAASLCDEPVRRFRGGHGRGPGATVVVVAMRQQVIDVRGDFVSATTDRNLALIHGDEIFVRVQVKNNSIYDVGRIVLKSNYRPARGGSRMEGIASVRGAKYDPSSDEFFIDRLGSNETVDITYRVLLRSKLGEGISQVTMTLNDFTVLEPGRRFQPPIPESSPSYTRQRVERVGIGGKEVSCVTGDPEDPRIATATALVSPVRRVEPGSMSVILPTSTYPKKMSRALSVRFPKTPKAIDPVRIRSTDDIVDTSGSLMPQTGWSSFGFFGVLLQILLGVAIAIGLYGVGMWAIWRRIR